jgi:PTH1 family peptidyl-tRNA hydrolase
VFLIAGLGNPGAEYAATRHNVGFMLADRLCEAFGIDCAGRDKLACYGHGSVRGREVAVIKPQTYMNGSGAAVAEFARRLSVEPGSVLVAYDDIDLPLGRIRVRPGGGTGGHRGMESVAARLGTTGFPRLRLGVGRPADGDVVGYVLNPFEEEELDTVDEMLERGLAAVECVVVEGVQTAMNRFNAT